MLHLCYNYALSMLYVCFGMHLLGSCVAVQLKLAITRGNGRGIDLKGSLGIERITKIRAPGTFYKAIQLLTRVHDR